MNPDNNAQPQQEMALPNCGQMIAKLPFGTRVIYFGIGLFWFVNLLSDFPKDYLASNSDTFFNNYRIWTLFTANLYVDRLFWAFLIIYNYSSFQPKLQEKMSTGVFMLKYFINGAVIQLLTLSIEYLLFYDEDSPVNGAGGIWFCLLFKYCFYNSQAQIKFCCFSWKFKRGIYPFVLFGVCVLLSFGIPLDMLVGLLYGVLQVMFEKVTVFPAGCTTKIGSLLNFTSIQCWIPYYQAHDCSDQAALSNLDEFQGQILVPKSSPETSVISDPFSKQKGTRLGDY